MTTKYYLKKKCNHGKGILNRPFSSIETCIFCDSKGYKRGSDVTDLLTHMKKYMELHKWKSLILTLKEDCLIEVVEE